MGNPEANNDLEIEDILDEETKESEVVEEEESKEPEEAKPTETDSVEELISKETKEIKMTEEESSALEKRIIEKLQQKISADAKLLAPEQKPKVEGVSKVIEEEKNNTATEKLLQEIEDLKNQFQQMTAETEKSQENSKRENFVSEIAKRKGLNETQAEFFKDATADIPLTKKNATAFKAVAEQASKIIQNNDVETKGTVAHKTKNDLEIDKIISQQREKAEKKFQI